MFSHLSWAVCFVSRGLPFAYIFSSVLKNELILTVIKPGEDIDHELAQLNARSCERAELTLEEAFVEYTSPNNSRALMFGMTKEGGPEK